MGLYRQRLDESIGVVLALMTKREKRIQKIRQNPRTVRYDDLVAVMEDYGFVLRESGGSHVFADCVLDENV